MKKSITEIQEEIQKLFEGKRFPYEFTTFGVDYENITSHYIYCGDPLMPIATMTYNPKTQEVCGYDEFIAKIKKWLRGEVKKICRNCKHWKREYDRGYGICELANSVEQSDESIFRCSQGCTYVTVGENFGCIYWEDKEISI